MLRRARLKAPAQVQIRPKVVESNDPEEALAERLELCAAHNPVRRKRCEGLKRELDKAFGSSDPLPGHLFQQIANVFGIMVRRTSSGGWSCCWHVYSATLSGRCSRFLPAAGSSVLLLVDAVRTLKSGAAEPSVEKLLQSLELPGVSIGSFTGLTWLWRFRSTTSPFAFCIEFAHERENLMRRNRYENP